MRRFKKQNNDPREITLKFNSVCAETGVKLAKGESAIYYPLAKQIYSLDSKQAQQFKLEKFDRDWLNINC